MTRAHVKLHRAALSRRLSVLTLASAVVAFVACKDSNVPFLTAPTSVAASPAGIQNALGGLFAGSRIDMSMGIPASSRSQSRWRVTERCSPTRSRAR